MKPWNHAEISANRYGGKPEDYIKIHDWFDQSKATMPDMRHRAILHNALGCFICEQVFGHTITNSDGKQVSVRTIAEQHVLDDLGHIPTVEEWLKTLPIEPWMAGGSRKYVIVD